MPIIKSKEIVGILHRNCIQRALDAVRPSNAILISERFDKNNDRGKNGEEEPTEGLHLEE